MSALIAGETDSTVLADLALGRMRSKRDMFAQAVTGRFTSHHAFLITEHLNQLDYLEGAVVRVRNAVATVVPLARHVRTGLHRRRGYTTQPVERSHVPTRDHLRGARGLRTVGTEQRFLESFEALRALRRDTVKLHTLVSTDPSIGARDHTSQS
jgi:hypothetical protein